MQKGKERKEPGQPRLVESNGFLHSKTIPAFKGIGFPPKFGRIATVHPGMAEPLTNLPLLTSVFVAVEEQSGTC